MLPMQKIIAIFLACAILLTGVACNGTSTLSNVQLPTTHPTGENSMSITPVEVKVKDAFLLAESREEGFTNTLLLSTEITVKHVSKGLDGSSEVRLELTATFTNVSPKTLAFLKPLATASDNPG